VRFLTQIDDQQAMQLGVVVRDPGDDLGEHRRIELVAPGGAERRVETAPRPEVAVLGGPVGASDAAGAAGHSSVLDGSS
jgi:hypothetical protein